MFDQWWTQFELNGLLFNTQIFYFWSPILSTVHPLSEWAHHSGLQYLNFHFRLLCWDHCLFKMKWESQKNWWWFIRTSSTIANGSKSHSPMFLYDFPVRDNNNNVSKTVASSKQGSHLNVDMCNEMITWTIHHSNFRMSRQCADYLPVLSWLIVASIKNGSKPHSPKVPVWFWEDNINVSKSVATIKASPATHVPQTDNINNLYSSFTLQST